MSSLAGLLSGIFRRRIAKRGIASVVNKNDITVSDFGVKNEPILGYMPGR